MFCCFDWLLEVNAQLSLAHTAHIPERVRYTNCPEFSSQKVTRLHSLCFCKSEPTFRFRSTMRSRTASIFRTADGPASLASGNKRCCCLDTRTLERLTALCSGLSTCTALRPLHPDSHSSSSHLQCDWLLTSPTYIYGHRSGLTSVEEQLLCYFQKWLVWGRNALETACLICSAPRILSSN